MFLHKPFIDSLSGMMLLAPMFLVFVQPFLDDGFEGIQLGGLLLDNRWSRGEVILCKVLAYRFRISTRFFRNFSDSVSTITQVFDMIDLGHSEHLPFLLYLWWFLDKG